MLFFMLRMFSCIPTLQKMIAINMCWIWSYIVSASVKEITYFSFKNFNIVNYIEIYLKVKPVWVSEYKTLLSCCIINFRYCWICFTKILLNFQIYAHVIYWFFQIFVWFGYQNNGPLEWLRFIVFHPLPVQNCCYFPQIFVKIIIVH